MRTISVFIACLILTTPAWAEERGRFRQGLFCQNSKYVIDVATKVAHENETVAQAIVSVNSENTGATQVKVCDMGMFLVTSADDVVTMTLEYRGTTKKVTFTVKRLTVSARIELDGKVAVIMPFRTEQVLYGMQ